MPGHSGVAGNCKADEHVRSGISVSLAAERERIEAPLTSCGSLLDD